MAVSESLSSVSDTIFNLDIIHRTDMQGNISARKQAEEKLQLYASVFSYAREGIMITDKLRPGGGHGGTPAWTAMSLCSSQ